MNDLSIKNKKIVIGSSGAGNAFASLLALRRSWGNSVQITAIDSNPKYLVSSSLISDKFYQVSKTDTAEFKKEIIKIISKEEADTYIPFLDHEIFVAAELYESEVFNKRIKIQVKSSKIADLCNDKYKTFFWLSEQNIVTPKCYLTFEAINKNENLIIKPRKGFGSKIFKLTENRENISKFNSETYIIQQECEKPEITVDVCYDKTRNFFSYICRERLEAKSGVCTKARLFYNEKIEAIAFTIAEKLDLSAFCFQLMDYKGEWAVTDINARLGAGTPMSVAVGLDFFSGMFAVLWDQDPSVYFRPLQKETFVTRQYCDFVMNM